MLSGVVSCPGVQAHEFLLRIPSHAHDDVAYLAVEKRAKKVAEMLQRCLNVYCFC